MNLNYDVVVDDVGVSSNETLTRSYTGLDQLQDCSIKGMVDEIRVGTLHNSKHDVEKGVVMGLEREMEVVDREHGGDGGNSSIKAVIGDFEGGELVESLDWVMKAAELLISGDESGREIDMSAIAQDFGLLLKNKVANSRVLSANPSISMEENILKLGEKEQVVVGNAVGSSSLRGEGGSYYSLLHDFFDQLPDKVSVMEGKAVDHGVSSIEPENEPMKDETQAKQLSKGVDFKSSGNKSNGVDLIVDLNSYVSINQNLDYRNGNQDIVIKKSMPIFENPNSTPKKKVNSRFSASNLVWGKIRSHPWWPGQIFDPSDSSKDAMSYFKKDSFLIAYFGDGTFAWTEASKLKPFAPHFSHMKNQSDMETFLHAVNCALDEVASRVEFALSCPCLSFSKESYTDIKSQTVFNSGIKTESRNRDVIDEYSNATSFEPVKLVDYIKELARDSNGVIDRLEHVIAISQVLSVSRWKGHPQLPEFNMLGGLLDDDVVIQYEVTEQVVPHDGSGKPRGQVGSSGKRKCDDSHDKISSGKKKRSLSDLMAGNDEIESEEISENALISSFSSKKSKSKQSQKTTLKNKSTEKPAANAMAEMLTQLCLYASNPMKRFNSIVSVVSFFSEFRNSIMLSEQDYVEDNYWTDKIIESKPEEQLLLDNQREINNVLADPTPSSKVDPIITSTALILNFTDLGSVPLEAHLNKIFSQFGPLNESETEVLKKSKRAKVVFKSRDDAETAFSSAGKYSIFGPSLVSYRLKYLSFTQQQKIASKRSRKTCGEGDASLCNKVKVKSKI